MSNPTPILNNINAFDATKGTTISFNIIGGTDIVRSNIVYIYDLSTNDLICTHLYISTESIHELPPNTDPSIVYASGKSSADFVNNKNYYLQIQTFTNTAGTAGGSGMSVAKTFWCLFNPALSVNAIPAAISTTSYNFGATYTTNITDVTIPVTNIIQQYKFDLYTATGTLVQTSGNIIGSGEQEGTSTTYNITYNFSGLVVNNSYYVVVTTTSTEGMTVSAQSNTFTVSVDTPTVGGAIVNNNACDGYISVVSNLSDEYGGHASGEMASFETDSVNNVSSLKVNMEPIQDLHGYDHPWVGGAGSNKWDEVWELGWISSTGDNRDSSEIIRSKNYIPVTPNTTYCIVVPASTDIVYFDDNKVAIGNTDKNGLGDTDRTANTRTTHDNCHYIRFWTRNQTTYNHDIAINYPSSVTTYSPYSNICPISGHDDVKVTVSSAEWLNLGGYWTTQAYYSSRLGLSKLLKVLPNKTYTIHQSGELRYALQQYGNKSRVMAENPLLNDSSWRTTSSFSITTRSDTNYIWLCQSSPDYAYDVSPKDGFGLWITSTDDPNYSTYTTDLNQTVYGGTLDLVTGVLTVDRVMVTFDGSDDETWDKLATSARQAWRAYLPYNYQHGDMTTNEIVVNETSEGTDPDMLSCRGTKYLSTYFYIFSPISMFETTDELKDWLASNPLQVCYELATPQTYQLTPHQIQTLVGQNNVWSDAGDVEVTFNLPISNLLVKRQDASDVSGDWLTLYSQPIAQASDMDFTFIDFLNQHGKTYRYALVPLLTQQQGDIDVEIEGGYTVSDDVLSVFDGVFVANSNGSQKLKAATEYGDLETNQDVGVLTTIGNKYPFVVSNSNLNYHSGSISALIVPSDFYTNGDLDRLDIVERREAIEKFLTDKTAKILKDWNGNIWLITFVENVEVSFVDDYGMGLGTLSAKWVEIGNVNDQTDLKQTGLI